MPNVGRRIYPQEPVMLFPGILSQILNDLWFLDYLGYRQCIVKLVDFMYEFVSSHLELV